MDTNIQNSNLTIRPMNEPHTPISEDEVNPTLQAASSGRNTLVTLASILVLVGVIGVTLWFYLQNRKPQTNTQTSVQNQKENTSVESEDANDVKEINGVKVAGAQNQALIEKYGVVCRMFKSIEEAIETPEIACIIDLSGQNANSISESVNQLPKLEHVILSNNSFSIIPQVLTNHPNVLYIDLSNNNISEIEKLQLAKDEVTGNSRKMTINLRGNPISESEAKNAKTNNPSVTFEF